eukprot:TRINITY_DN858_c0_g1_i3.p1 TRINITY_DN858_c0_g1~~TRINITY_DN858_c0_g1_i3.p1  ORF type:complete len:198 (+),score=57.38 TRINITY_DN858_c0_g1_i3:43-594(+)
MNMFKTALALGLAATAMAQTPAPTDPCSVLTHNVGSCQLGQQLVDLNTMTTCKNYICSNLMSIYAIAHGADMTKKLQGQSYGCQIEDWDGTGVGDVICMPNSGGGGGGGSSGGMSGGAIFLIILFVGFAVYLAGGIVYMAKVKGESGINMIPHIEFWKDLPNLMKDGAFFIKNKVTGGGYSSV